MTINAPCFRVDENCFLYGVFDGHCGVRAAEFVSQRLPAEILLGQLDSVRNDDDVKQVLLQVGLLMVHSLLVFVDLKDINKNEAMLYPTSIMMEMP